MEYLEAFIRTWFDEDPLKGSEDIVVQNFQVARAELEV